METVRETDIGVDVYTDGEDHQQIHAVDADYSRCPKCESPNITYGDCEPDGVFVYRTHACDECGTTWEERYDLVQVKITTGNLTIIEKEPTQ